MRVLVSGFRDLHTCRLVHSWVHSWGKSSTHVVTVLPFSSHPSQRRCFRRSAANRGAAPLHTRWTTLGAERHVDLWTTNGAVHTVPGTTKAPVPDGTRAFLAGRRRRRGQRQRIDMTRPITMAPNPTPKFQIPIDTMKPSLLPAM